MIKQKIIFTHKNNKLGGLKKTTNTEISLIKKEGSELDLKDLVSKLLHLIIETF